MKVCILGNGLTGLTLAKALVNKNIHVDLFTQKKIQNLVSLEQLVSQKAILIFLIKV